MSKLTDQIKQKYAIKKEALKQELGKKWQQNIDKVAALRKDILQLEQSYPELLAEEKAGEEANEQEKE